MAKDVLNNNNLPKDHEQVLSKVLTGTYKKPFFVSSVFWIIAYALALILYIYYIYLDLININNTSDSSSSMWFAYELFMVYLCANGIKENYQKYKNEEK